MRPFAVLGIFAAGPIFQISEVEISNFPPEDSGRLVLIDDLQFSISSLLRELEKCPESETEKEVMMLRSPHQGAQMINRFRNLQFSLEEKLARNEKEALMIRMELRRLWTELNTDPVFCLAFEKATIGSKPSIIQRLKNELVLRRIEMESRRKDVNKIIGLFSEVEPYYDTCANHYDQVVAVEMMERENNYQELNNNYQGGSADVFRKITNSEQQLAKISSLRVEKQARLAKFYCHKEQVEILKEILGLCGGGKIPDDVQKMLRNWHEIHSQRGQQDDMLLPCENSLSVRTSLSNEDTFRVQAPRRCVSISQPATLTSRIRIQPNSYVSSNFNHPQDELDFRARHASQQMSTAIVPGKSRIRKPTSEACCLIIKL